MKKTFLFIAALAMSAMMWAGEVTLTNAQIVAGTGGTSYGTCTAIDDAGNTWSAYAIKNHHSGATSGYKFWQIKKYGSSTAYYIQVPTMPEAIQSITLTVSSSQKPMSDGGNTATLFFSASNETDAAGEGVASGTGASSVTIDASDLNLTSGYITAGGAVRIWAITVTYGSASTVTLDSLIIKGKAEKMEYEVGEAFDPAGLEVWGIYTKIEKGDSTSQIKSGVEWSIDPETFAEASDNASVTLVASYKELTTTDTTITGIKVNEPAPLPKYATIYTSNIEYGGSDTVIYDKVKYGAKKMAKNTPATITVPAGTKTLHIHAAAWNKEGNEWTISGLTEDVKITTVADAGVSGNPPFTLQNDPAENDYFAIETNNNAALTLTITLPKDKRGVIFGINAEMQEGVIAAPAFTPATTDFDGSVEVTLTCETEGAEIFYALNEEVTSMNATKYTEPIKLTATTTIYAVAKKEGKESAPANKTYNLVPVYTLAELVAAGAPTTAGKKVILVLENEKITGVDSNRGIYVKSGNQEVEIFCYNLPETAVKGAYVSGRTMGDWLLYSSTWELKPADWSWATFTTTPTALQQVMMQGNIRKMMHNGRIMILKDNQLFNLQGMLVK